MAVICHQTLGRAIYLHNPTQEPFEMLGDAIRTAIDASVYLRSGREKSCTPPTH